MLPKFEWNTTTKLIVIIIIVFIACWSLNAGVVEKFIGNEILTCPDRLYFDGRKYYLFQMNKPIIENINPIVYTTYQEYLKNKPEKCKELPLTKPYTRYLKNKVSDPVLPYGWDCQRELAVDTAKQNDCINKTYNIFTEEECNLFKDMPSRYYTNNAIERCKVRKLINDHPEFIGDLKPNADIGFTEDGLIRVGADLGGDPFRNIS
jgi:hypothetical protein